MNCSSCKNEEMEKGFLVDSFWKPNMRLFNLIELKVASFVTGGRLEIVYAWRCPTCQKVELYSEGAK